MTYRDRRAARAERLLEWAEKREAKSSAAFKAAHTIADGIPFGQPILVGHHSEKRARRDQDRIFNGMQAGVENQAKASEMRSRAYNIEDAADRAIYSDDPDAIEQLQEKIARLEAERAQMVAENSEYRRTHKAELKAAASAYQRSLLVPHPGYALQNLGGNITRLRKRLKYLSGQLHRVEQAPQEGTTATARTGLVVTVSMTTPTRPGKAPRPVWIVSGALAEWRQFLIGLDGRWYRGAFSFFENPTEDIERACSEAEGERSTSP